ncbi:MAG: M50 family metallopeptidase [Clostridia bacterium]|nr:M50 family metallopeptidase [Clostridia bacterium]
MILLYIFFFGLLIFTHELGHFALAKAFKVKVDEFSVGMGPKLFTKKKGQTQYSIRLFPIGGFVSMKGEKPFSDNENKEGSFHFLPPYKKALILVAGAFANITMGIILMIISVSQTPAMGSTTIESVTTKDTTSLLKPKDKIVEINNNKIYDYLDINFFFALDKDGIVDMQVIRDGKKVELESVDFKSNGIKLKTVKKTPFLVLKKGFYNSFSVIRLVFASVQKMIVGEVKLNDMAGPIGTIDVLNSASKTANIGGILFLMALISINIGVFNLLPIPGLDGGNLFFVVIEGIRRKPVSLKTQAIINTIGMLLLFGLIILISMNDLIRIIQR